MATLKLKKTPAAAPSAGPKRAPVRGRSAPRKQLTLAQAQAERAAFAERLRESREAPPERRRAERPDRPGRPDRPDPTGRPDRTGRPERAPSAHSGERADRGERGAAPARTERRPPRDEFAQRPGASERPRRSNTDAPRASGPVRREVGGPAPRPAPRSGPPTDREPREPRERRPLAPAQRAGTGAPVRPRSQPAPASARDEGERLSKRMTSMGLSSRREADDWIAAGWVRVDGRIAVLGQRVGPDAQITIDPAATQQQAQRVTVLLNKPVGYVSGQAEDGHEPAVVLVKPATRWAGDRSGINFHPGHLRGLAPAGRLDIDSVGLLVLTQDGRVAKTLVGDQTRIEKEYLVRVEYTRGTGRLPDGDLALLEHGLELDGEALKPAKVSWQNEDQLRFVLREGKKRQIRRMCEAVGLRVLSLKRVRIGSVALGQLPAGQWRYLAPFEKF